MVELPCSAEGVCLVCGCKPGDDEVLLCNSCSSPWHMRCLKPPLLEVPLGDWECPDCSLSPQHCAAAPAAALDGGSDDLMRKIRAIQADPGLSEAEKARKRQELLSRRAAPLPSCNDGGNEEDIEERWRCLYCIKPLERPVTTPCGHNFCLGCLETACFKKGQKHCPKCRAAFGTEFIRQPRINAKLVTAIRMAKAAACNPSAALASSRSAHLQNESRPDKAFVSERAKRKGLANACSGKLFVNVPNDYFGPILGEHDTKYGLGVMVGRTFDNRLEVRQWGIHLPHVAGIAGQSLYGAQSVVLSGGYVDDEDHGEWFLYTGSGGRDLKTGNKRTSKDQTDDQQFSHYNEALRVSCKKGYPVRVVRSYKDKRSAYAPECKKSKEGNEKVKTEGFRYDGIYRIEKCWRKIGLQGKMVCRYLFVRCDNEPAPWRSEMHGDRPRPMPEPKELEAKVIDLTHRKAEPWWGWKENECVWGWLKAPPLSNAKKAASTSTINRKRSSLESKLKKEFTCGLCKKVLESPVSTPCGHNFCLSCLVGAFDGVDVRQRGGRRMLRVQKIVKRCPGCSTDISDFLGNPKVNNDMRDIIESLKKEIEKKAAEVAREAEEAKEREQEEDIEEDNDGEEEADEEVAEEAEEGDEQQQQQQQQQEIKQQVKQQQQQQQQQEIKQQVKQQQQQQQQQDQQQDQQQQQQKKKRRVGDDDAESKAAKVIKISGLEVVIPL